MCGLERHTLQSKRDHLQEKDPVPLIAWIGAMQKCVIFMQNARRIPRRAQSCILYGNATSTQEVLCAIFAHGKSRKNSSHEVVKIEL